MSERQGLNRILKDNKTAMPGYVIVKLRPIVKTEWKPKTTLQRICPPLKKTYSLTDWKVSKVPYNLYRKGESNISGTNPLAPQKSYVNRTYLFPKKSMILLISTDSFDI